MKKIGKNIKYLRSLKSLTQEQLAEELSLTRSRIGSYEEGRSEPSIETLIQLSQYFGLPIDILVKNDLSLCDDQSFIEVGNQRVLFPILINQDNQDLIEIISIKASAGYLKGYADPEYIEQLENIKLPFLPSGKHRAFPIEGDSMLPLKEGSYVIGKFIENFNKIKSGKTYIILTTNDGIIYKRVYNQLEKNKTLLLCSDNKLYPNFEIPIHEILEIWEFTCSIHRQEFSEEELKVDAIQKTLNDLQLMLKDLNSK